ncbi:MAG: MOSC domain-containing protein [Bacteroidota bacterium]
MKIISTNIAQPTTVSWRGKEVKTGIYKHPTKEPIFLGKEDVVNDAVIDRKHHGGEYKACYLFSSECYGYWHKKYPALSWNWGMFGENLTVEGLNENQIRIGDIYKVGSAVVQVTEPRQPCYKLGIKFGSQKVLKEFIAHGHPGTYVRILTEGSVTKGDIIELVEQSQTPLSVQQYHLLVNRKSNDPNLIRMAVANVSIPKEKRELLKKRL